MAPVGLPGPRAPTSHAALRQVLGPQALQSGSYNRPGYLRLDFAPGRARSASSKRNDIEDVANAAVRADHKVTASYMTLPEAQAFGALALFGETYGEQVRVVEIGGPWSREPAVARTCAAAQIGTLALTGESSVGSGSRRVEAVVGLEGFRYLARERDLVRQLADLLKTPQDGLVERVSGMLARLRDVDKELAELRGSRPGRGRAARLVRQGRRRRRRGHRIAGRPGRRDLRTLALDVRGRLGGDRARGGPARVESGGKVALVAARTRPPSTADCRRTICCGRPGPVGGRGGGKADVAQGGGTDPAGIPAALQAGEQAVAPPREGDQRVGPPSTTPRTPAPSGTAARSGRPSRRPGRGPLPRSRRTT